MTTNGENKTSAVTRPLRHERLQEVANKDGLSVSVCLLGQGIRGGGGAAR